MKLFESSSSKLLSHFLASERWLYSTCARWFLPDFCNLWLLRGTDGFLAIHVKVGKAASGLTLPMVTHSSSRAPGFVLGWVTRAGWSPRWEQRQRPCRRAAREETQNNRQGNPTQNNKLASTKERSLLESHYLRAGGLKKSEQRRLNASVVPKNSFLYAKQCRRTMQILSVLSRKQINFFFL